MIIYLLSNIVCNLHSFFDLTYFWEVGQKYINIFVRFLVQMKTSESHSEINWPLVRTYWCTIIGFPWRNCLQVEESPFSHFCPIKTTQWRACLTNNSVKGVHTPPSDLFSQRIDVGLGLATLYVALKNKDVNVSNLEPGPKTKYIHTHLLELHTVPNLIYSVSL